MTRKKTKIKAKDKNESEKKVMRQDTKYDDKVTTRDEDQSNTVTRHRV